MKTGLKLAGLGVVFVTVVFWFFGGMNTGWTKTTVTTMAVDPVTQLDYPVVEKRFVPGVDFVAAGAAAGLLLLGGSLFAGRRPQESAAKKNLP